MPLTAAERKKRQRAKQGATGRRKDKVRKRQQRDSVRHDSQFNSSSKLNAKTLATQAAERAVAAGVLDDHRADALVKALETLPRVKTDREADAWLKTTAENLAKAEIRHRSELFKDSEAAMREFDMITGDVDTPDFDRPRVANSPTGATSESSGPAIFFVVQRDSKLERWILAGLKAAPTRDDGLTVRKVPQIPK